MSTKTFEIESSVYMSPCVYEIHSVTKLLYVGFSAKGFRRVFSYNPSAERDRAKAILQSTRIVVTAFSSASEAYQKERELIHAHHPEFNKQCDECSQVQRLEGKVKDEQKVFAAGRQAFLDGILEDGWPKVGKPGSGIWYRTMKVWQAGWRRARFERAF